MLLVIRATTKTLANGILSKKKSHAMVFQASRKSMIKVIQASSKFMPQFQGPIFGKN